MPTLSLTQSTTGVAYSRVHASIRISGQQAQAGYWTAWDDHVAFVREAMGAPIPGTRAYWVRGHQLPEAPGLYVQDYQAEQVGVTAPDGSGQVGTTLAKVTLTYGNQPWGGEDEVKLTYEMEAGAKYIQLPGGTLRYVSDGKRFNVNGAGFVAEKRYVVTRNAEHAVFRLQTTLDPLLNRVNAAGWQVHPDGPTHPAGTVLFVGYRMSEQQTKFGDNRGTVALEFAYSVVPHNDGARPGSTSGTYPGYEPVAFDAAGAYKQYPTADLPSALSTTY